MLLRHYMYSVCHIFPISKQFIITIIIHDGIDKLLSMVSLVDQTTRTPSAALGITISSTLDN